MASLHEHHPTTVPALLTYLQETTPPADGVLTAFVATPPGRAEGQAFLVSYRDGCQAARSALPAAEHDAFNAAAARVDQYLAEGFKPTGAGIAIFASRQPDYFFVAPLPAPPLEAVLWGPLPVVAPLAAALDDYERVAVALFDSERARLFTICLGEIEERRTWDDEVPGKQDTGGWFGLAQGRYARHREDHILRHAKRTVRALTDLLRTRPFDRLLLAGPDEAIAVLRQQLPRPLRARLSGTLALELFASEAEVLQAAVRAATAIERQSELEAVNELLDAPNGGQGVLGVDPTLSALADGRVYTLFVADTLTGSVEECQSCGSAFVARDGRCPRCGAPLESAADLYTYAVTRALEQGARLEQVSGPAADKLLAYGGLGAWTRY